MNKACMAKLGWRLRTEGGSLWVQTLLTKYKSPNLRGHRSKSNALKGIEAANPFVEAILARIVRNGRTTRFWMDRWLGNQPFYDQLREPLSLPELYVNVSNYWEECRGWKWD